MECRKGRKEGDSVSIRKILSHQCKCRRIMFKKIYIFLIRCNVAALFFPHRLLILPKSNISWKVEKVFSSNFALTFYGEAKAVEASQKLHAGSWSICQECPPAFSEFSALRFPFIFSAFVFPVRVQGFSIFSPPPPDDLYPEQLPACLRPEHPSALLRFIFPQSALKNIVAAWSDTNSAYHFW